MITFERWLAYCSHVADDGAPGPGFEADQAAVEALTPLEVAVNVTQLLYAIALASDKEQLARTLWFVFGDTSGYARMILKSGEVPRRQQVDWLGALRDAYAKVFDSVCCASGSDPDGRYYDRDAIDIAVYMLWDISGLADLQLGPSDADLDAARWQVVDAALRCRTSTCAMSAFHGLGHMWRHSADRVAKRIDEALVERAYPPWVREYAGRARIGQIE